MVEVAISNISLSAVIMPLFLLIYKINVLGNF
jgi:hypothetical protein